MEETTRPTETKKQNWFARHKVLTAIMIVVILAIAFGGGSSSKDSNSNKDNNQSATSDENKTESKPSIAKIGEAVKDGKFEFTVNKMTCGEASVGGEYLKEEAQGQFCRINVTVKNIGNEAQTLSHSDQYAYNAAEQKFSANSTAAIYANSGSSTWYDSINPGNTVTGDIFFDIPKDTTPVTIELHDSAFSGGVKVSLQ